MPLPPQGWGLLSDGACTRASWLLSPGFRCDQPASPHLSDECGVKNCVQDINPRDKKQREPEGAVQLQCKIRRAQPARGELWDRYPSQWEWQALIPRVPQEGHGLR